VNWGGGPNELEYEVGNGTQPQILSGTKTHTEIYTLAAPSLVLQCGIVVMWCRVLQCGSVVQCDIVWHSVLHCDLWYTVQDDTVCCSVLQCVTAL